MRIFSVDGCHTKEHTINDISLAQATLAKGGVIIVDDILNDDWPGVREGVNASLQNSKNTLVPFFLGANKLVLCEKAFSHFYKDAICNILDSLGFDDILNQKSTFSGLEVISHSLPSPDHLFVERIFKSRIAEAHDKSLQLMEGFSSPEPWGAWTDGPTARASFKLGMVTPHSSHLLRLYGHAYIPTHNDEKQLVDFKINENKLAKINFSKKILPEYLDILVPVGTMLSGLNELEIKVGCPTSPKSEGLSEDSRLLGFALAGMDLFEVSK